MLEIKTLEGCTFKEIEEVFNLSFSDYYFPIRFTAQQLEQKFEREDGNLMLSVGVFDNGKLVGFILHFLSKLNGEVALYNGGTGVIPTHRGHGLTQRMWMFIQPTLKEYRVEKMILEVLTVNEPAIAIYKRIGFKLKRTLNCYKGRIVCPSFNSGYEIRGLTKFDWSLLASFWDFEPTWQNSINTIKNSLYAITAVGVFDNLELVGYTFFDLEGNRLHQLAVSKNHRRKGIASLLLSQLSVLTPKPISFINLDTRISGLRELMEKFGLSVFTQQYEMELIPHQQSEQS